MICNFRHLVFVVVLAVTFSHHTFAPWTKAPDVPPSNRRENCKDWILYHDFTESNPETNRQLATRRNRNYDKDVNIWAALYASFLTIFRQYTPISPEDFCSRHQMSNSTLKRYRTLNDSPYPCSYWIRIYGFEANTPEDLWDLVSLRFTPEDFSVAIWPSLYAHYISIDENRATKTQEDFCNEMGYNNDDYLSFVSIHATIKTCKEWIEFAGYNEDVDNNMELALRLNTDYDNIINEYIKKYTQELRIIVSLNMETNLTFTRNLMNNSEDIEYKTPEAFCNTFGATATWKRHYKYNY